MWCSIVLCILRKQWFYYALYIQTLFETSTMLIEVFNQHKSRINAELINVMIFIFKPLIQFDSIALLISFCLFSNVVSSSEHTVTGLCPLSFVRSPPSVNIFIYVNFFPSEIAPWNLTKRNRNILLWSPSKIIQTIMGGCVFGYHLENS